MSEPAGASFRGMLGKLFARLRPPSGQAGCSTHAAWLEDAIAALFGFPDGGDEADEQVMLRDTALQVEDDRRSYAAAVGIIRDLVHEELILGERAVAYEQFARTFERLFDKANYRRQRPAAAVVTICGADVAPNRTYDQVFVTGLLEGDFPRRQGSAGFTGADEVARWASFGVDLENPRNHPGFEGALFLSLANRARLRLHLSYPRYEMGGDETIPSFFLTCESRRPAGVSVYVPPCRDAASRPLSASDYFLGLYWQEEAAEPPAVALADERLAAFHGQLMAPVEMARSRLIQSRQSIYNGWLCDFVESGALTSTPPARWSASSLNRYGQCPFKFWVADVLKLSVREEPEARLTVDRRGRLYHRAMELFHRRLRDAGVQLAATDPAALAGAIAGATGDALAEMERERDFRPGRFWEYEKHDIAFRLRSFVDFELRRAQSDGERFEPALFEEQFGKREGAAPLRISCAGREVEIAGVIDRVDVAQAGDGRRVRIIDYKSGTTRITTKDAWEGRNLQMPLYALAIEQVLMPGAAVSRGEYLSINGRTSVGALDFSGGDGDLAARTVELVGEFEERVGRGDFTVRPSIAQVCKKCEHKRVCRVNELRWEEADDGDAD